MTNLQFRTRSFATLFCFLLLAAVSSFAQGHGPAGGAGGSGQPPGGGGPQYGNPSPQMPSGQGPGGPGGKGGPPGSPPPRPSGVDGTTSTMRGGLQLGPPGRWWDDKGFAKSLGLRPEQRKKMDDIFNANKGTILLRYQSLQQEEARLEDITREPRLDEPTIFAAIDRVAQARAALEKANAHMLLLIRQEMDKNQTERLEQHR